MGSADWTDATSSLSTSSVRRSETAGFARPPGGGTFTFGFASQDSSSSIVARYCNLSGTDPTSKGGDISAAMERSALSAGPVGFAPFLFFCASSADISADAYMLGLADGNPAHFILRKGVMSQGLPDVPPGQQGVLAQSAATLVLGTWYHIKLEVVVNLSGDVVINCYQSDLTANLVSAPVWTVIPGMPQIIDDALGVNTGSLPYTAGRLGYAFATSQPNRVALFDEIRPTTQV
jgi:hypothetical protein